MSNVDDSLPLVAGLDWGVVLTMRRNEAPDEAVFSPLMRLRADVRDFPGAPVLLGTLTNSNGGIEVIDANTLILRIDPLVSARASDSHVYLDLVRLDVSPAVYLYVLVKVPVLQPVTRLTA